MPRVYVRDNGLLQTLFGVPSVQALQAQPAAGPSWEGFVVEQVAAALPPGAQLACYRAAAGGEPDLAVEFAGRRLGVEVKFSAAPKPQRGFWLSLDDLGVERAVVAAPVERGYTLGSGVEVVPAWRVGGGSGGGQPSTGKPQQGRSAGLRDTTLWPVGVRGVSGARVAAAGTSNFFTISPGLAT